MRNNLFTTLGQEMSENSKRALLDKVEELTKQLEVIENEKTKFRHDLELSKSQVLNLDNALKIVRQFGKNFRKLKAHEQTLILSEIVHKVVVQENGITVEYYAGAREDLLPVGPAFLLSVNDSAGIELSKAEGLPDRCSSSVQFGGAAPHGLAPCSSSGAGLFALSAFVAARPRRKLHWSLLRGRSSDQLQKKRRHESVAFFFGADRDRTDDL